MTILRSLSLTVILTVAGMAQTSGPLNLTGNTATTLEWTGPIVGSIPAVGPTPGLLWNGNTGSWTPNGFQETRKDDGKGPTLQQVKMSGKLVTSKMLAPAAYLEIAKQIGLNPSASTDEAEILEAIQHGAFHVYDFDKVDGYLWRQALKEKSPSTWVWKAMRHTDWESMAANGFGHSASGVISGAQYARTLPLRIMNDVRAILDCFPDAKFLVSDYEVVRPDPFLAVTTPSLFAAGKIWIIDCWDEPGFTEVDRTVGIVAKK
jgi:hypothetical protein